MEAVCILLQQKDNIWTTAKTVLADPNFLSSLFNFDKDRISFHLKFHLHPF